MVAERLRDHWCDVRDLHPADCRLLGFGKVYRSLTTSSAGIALGDSIVLRPTGCQISLIAGVGDHELPLSGIDPAKRLDRPGRWRAIRDGGCSWRTVYR